MKGNSEWFVYVVIPILIAAFIVAMALLGGPRDLNDDVVILPCGKSVCVYPT